MDKISINISWPLHCKIREEPIHSKKNFPKSTLKYTSVEKPYRVAGPLNTGIGAYSSWENATIASPRRAITSGRHYTDKIKISHSVLLLTTLPDHGQYWVTDVCSQVSQPGPGHWQGPAQSTSLAPSKQSTETGELWVFCWLYIWYHRERGLVLRAPGPQAYTDGLRSRLRGGGGPLPVPLILLIWNGIPRGARALLASILRVGRATASGAL